MSNLKISALPVAPSVQTTDLVPIVDTAGIFVTQQATVGQLTTPVIEAVATLPAAATVSATDLLPIVAGGTGAAESITVAQLTTAITAAAWTEAEVDFGTQPVTMKTLVLVDANVDVGDYVTMNESGEPATGRGTGDAEWDTCTFVCKAEAGQIRIYAQAVPGPVVGKRTVNYTVSKH